ncbi:sensor domain-containing protein [uncultured Rothia sp.]|uniref:sensor domain-containing protein n=1 Tax=uncultured Rothia sp. TaxID=316088 RepID=UPI0032176888
MESTTTSLSANPPKNLWHYLGSASYLFSKAPSLALFSLLLLATLMVVVGSLLTSLIFILVLPLMGMAFGYFERWRLKMMGFGEIANNHVEISRSNLWEWVKFRYLEPASWRETLALGIACMMGGIAAVVLVIEFALFFFSIGLMIELLRGRSIENQSLYGSGDDLYIASTSSHEVVLPLPHITPRHVVDFSDQRRRRPASKLLYQRCSCSYLR